jgi:hypothetical protein
MQFKSQVTRDRHRDTYLVTFPSDLDAERTLAWLRSISGTLPKRSGGAFSKDTLVFETWATSSGITHRLMTPRSASEYIAAQLRTHGRGVTVTKDDTRPTVDWTAGVSVGMSSPLRQLRIPRHSDLAASLLGSIQALQGDEMVMIQWVLSPAPFETPPSKEVGSMSAEFSVKSALIHGPRQATGDEVTDRRSKLDEQNLLGIGRIMARAADQKRAGELILRVESSLAAAGTATNHFKFRDPQKELLGKDKKLAALKASAADALSPAIFPAQFNLTELAGVIAWPIGQPFVAGLPQGATRHVYATEDIPTDGRILGDSNYPGHERPIALSYDYATQHMLITGKTGTGKTVLMGNTFGIDVARGYGAIVIDASNSDSNETMFNQAKRLIPDHRIEDTIILDVNEGRSTPLGFNILEQGNPRFVADQVTQLFANLYNETAGVYTRRLLFYGIYTLAEVPGLTMLDLLPLLERSTPEEAAWADGVIASVKDRGIREFWESWKAKAQPERERHMQPLINRMFQLKDRPEIRDIIGQSSSSFLVEEVLQQNKILLVNLAGLPPETSSVLGTLLVNSIWTAAQRLKPERPDFLYLDEFQVMTSKLPFGLDDMLNRARKHNLGVVMATQYLEDVPAEVRNAAINNARTKVIYQTSAKEARMWAAEFGKTLDDSDFMRIRQYEAVAQIATSSGITAPVTIRSRPPMKSTGNALQVMQRSREKFGRPIAQVMEERDKRRTVTDVATTKKKRPSLGEKWGR